MNACDNAAPFSPLGFREVTKPLLMSSQGVKRRLSHEFACEPCIVVPPTELGTTSHSLFSFLFSFAAFLLLPLSPLSCAR